MWIEHCAPPRVSSPCKNRRNKNCQFSIVNYICGRGGIGRHVGFRCCHLREGFLIEGNVMESKFQPFDINKYCRVYFAFLDKNSEITTLYYERPQIMPDQAITSEALINAEDMKKRFGLLDLVSIFIARTPSQVAQYEAKL